MVMDTIRLSEWEERTEQSFINFNYLEFIDTENFYIERTKKQHGYVDAIIFCLGPLFF